MCQYDRRRMPAGLLDHAGIRAHSSVVINGAHKPNAFFDPAPPAEECHPTAASVHAKVDELGQR